MSRRPEAPLSRREREILDIVYAKGAATAREVRDALADPPSYSAVRGLVGVLERKGHLVHQREGVRNVYRPTRAHDQAGRSAMKRALDTFFFGDVRSAVRAQMEWLSVSLVNKLLDEPTRRLRAEAGQGPANPYADVTRELFGLTGERAERAERPPA